MLSVRDVYKSFGRIHAVRGVSFELSPGRVTGLLGPNGAGKTTTIRVITGYFPPDRGAVSVLGFDTISQSEDARRCVGYLPESAPLYPEMTPASYLDYRGRLFGLARAERKAAIGRALERCWLGDVRDRRIAHLSKGYKQRVGLAGALLHDPKLLVLDEPTNGLDPTQIRETRRLMRELAQDRTLLLSSHVLSEVERVCEDVVIIAGGRVRASGSLGELVGRSSAAPTHLVDLKPVGGAEGAMKLLSAVAGVAGVVGVARAEAGGIGETGFSRFSVTPAAGVRDVREGIARACHEAGVLIRELRIDAPGLERVFIDLVEAGEGAEGAA